MPRKSVSCRSFVPCSTTGSYKFVNELTPRDLRKLYSLLPVSWSQSTDDVCDYGFDGMNLSGNSRGYERAKFNNGINTAITINLKNGNSKQYKIKIFRTSVTIVGLKDPKIGKMVITEINRRIEDTIMLLKSVTENDITEILSRTNEQDGKLEILNFPEDEDTVKLDYIRRLTYEYDTEEAIREFILINSKIQKDLYKLDIDDCKVHFRTFNVDVGELDLTMLHTTVNTNKRMGFVSTYAPNIDPDNLIIEKLINTTNSKNNKQSRHKFSVCAHGKISISSPLLSDVILDEVYENFCNIINKCLV